MKRSLAVVLVGVVVAMVVSSASAAVIPVGDANLVSSGSNSTLSSHKYNFYIPTQQATSGDLGTLISSKKYVGLQKDKIRLSQGGSSTGYVDIDETFALSEPMDAESAKLALTFKDLDLLTQTISGGTLTETLTITYHPLEGDDITLTIDSTNYTNFRTDGKTKTNKTKVTYYIDLVADLGLSLSDIDDINSGLSLPITFELSSTITRTGKGSRTYANTAENFTAQLQYEPGQGTPEPMTMALLVAGLPLLMRRNRK
jgi:hypothetical protein